MKNENILALKSKGRSKSLPEEKLLPDLSLRTGSPCLMSPWRRSKQLAFPVINKKNR